MPDEMRTARTDVIRVSAPGSSGFDGLVILTVATGRDVLAAILTTTEADHLADLLREYAYVAEHG